MRNFNPLTPCGVRRMLPLSLPAVSGFQSTHPMRGETAAIRPPCSFLMHFNPLTPCGVRLPRNGAPLGAYDFNPLTPCGVRRGTSRRGMEEKIFQSTHPMRDETILRVAFGLMIVDFNPLTPCGVRRFPPLGMACSRAFQSTHPMRGETPCSAAPPGPFPISIHSPHAG